MSGSRESMLHRAAALKLPFQDYATLTEIPLDEVVRQAAQMGLSEPEGPAARLTVPEVDPEVLMLQGATWSPRKGRRSDEPEPAFSPQFVAHLLGYTSFWLRSQEADLAERFGWEVPRVETKSNKGRDNHLRGYSIPFIELEFHALARLGAIEGEQLADGMAILVLLARQWGYLPRQRGDGAVSISDHPAFRALDAQDQGPLPVGASINDLLLTKRAYNRLSRAGILTVSRLLECTEADLMAIRAFGGETLADVKDRLEAHGLALRPEVRVPPPFPGLSTRSANFLVDVGVDSGRTLASLSAADLERLCAETRNCGPKMFGEIKGWVRDNGHSPRKPRKGAAKEGPTGAGPAFQEPTSGQAQAREAARG